MSEAGHRFSPPANESRLSAALREVRTAFAERDDVVVEMRESQRTRLELLAEELEPVFAEVPAESRNFDFTISSGSQPRLWIDAVSHVVMGRDRRTYRFVRDTRLGRVVLAESPDIKPVADQVTRYVAERLVERQRMIQGDADIPAPWVRSARIRPADMWGSFLVGLALVVAGGAVGIVTMLFYLALKFPEMGISF